MRELLSDMYLDTDVSRRRGHRARCLAESSYGLDEIERVLIDEIHPACAPNLRIVPGGAWTGFEMDRLEGDIERAARSRLEPVRRALGFRRRRALRTEEWRLTRQLILSYRNADGGHGGDAERAR